MRFTIRPWPVTFSWGSWSWTAVVPWPVCRGCGLALSAIACGCRAVAGFRP